MANPLQDKGIPILDKLVKSKKPAVESLEPEPILTPAEVREDSQNSVKSAFEATVEAIITEVLNRHLAKAREEITREILSEVRARLPGKKRK